MSSVAAVSISAVPTDRRWVICTRRSRDGPAMRFQPVDDFRSLRLIEQVAGLGDVFAAQLDCDVPIQFRLFFAARCAVRAEESSRRRTSSGTLHWWFTQDPQRDATAINRFWAGVDESDR